MRTQREVARLAAQQHGVVSLQQLVELGHSESAIRRGVESGRLHRLHRGVFAVGHPGISRHGQCLAAVLARGDQALLGYQSAAWLWGMLPILRLPIEVSVPWRGHRKSPLQAHHCPALREEDTSSHEGVPVTGVARTLLDVASGLRPRQLDRAIERSRLMGHLDLDDVDRLLDEVRGHPGRGRLRRGLEMYRDPAAARSGGELRFLELLREAGLPRPKVNTFIEGFEIDLYWEPERFAVELDGWDPHRTRTAFEDDPRRHEELKLAGIELVRFTGRRLSREPDQIAERIRIFLDRRRAELGLEPGPDRR